MASFDNIIALANGEPSAESWRTICEFLAGQSVGAMPKGYIEKLDGLLTHWPDKLRATMCGMKWDENFVKGKRDPRHTIVRHLKYDRIFAGRYGGTMMRDPRLVPGQLAKGGIKGWERLTMINLSYQNMNKADLAALAKAKLPEVRVLNIGEVDGEAIEAVCKAPWLSQIAEMSMSLNGDYKKAISALAEAPLHKLETLWVSSPSFNRATARAFATSEALVGLRKLSIYGSTLSRTAAEGLSTGLSGLRELSLTRTNMDSDAVEALLGGVLRPETLSISNNAIKDEGAVVISRCGDFLTSLSLSGTALTDEGLEALAESRLGKLSELSLSKGFSGDPQNKFTSKGLCALLDSVRLSGLRSLQIEGEFDAIKGRNLAYLESLKIKGAASGIDWRVVGEGLGASLQTLELVDAGMAVDDSAALMAGVSVSALESLNLSGNRLDVRAIRRLSTAIELKRLTLAGCGLSADDVEALMGSEVRPEWLVLDDNDLGDDIVEVLAKDPILSKVQRLGLESTGISDRGAVALAKSKQLATVERVHLDKNQIGDKGVVALAKRVARGGGWMKVGLGGNPYDAKGTRALKKAPPRCCP